MILNRAVLNLYSFYTLMILSNTIDQKSHKRETLNLSSPQLCTVGWLAKTNTTVKVKLLSYKLNNSKGRQFFFFILCLKTSEIIRTYYIWQNCQFHIVSESMEGSTSMTHGRTDKQAKDSRVHYKNKFQGITCHSSHIPR